MINFICEYWPNKPERAKELDFCIQSNAKQPYTGKVILAVEKGVVTPALGSNVETVVIPDRSYYTLFKLGSDRFPGEMVVVCNTDIYFEPELPKQLEGYDFEKQVLVLSRWDLRELGKPPVPFRTAGSYDAYIWRSPFYLPETTTFTPGINGCDSALAFVMNPFRKVLNPADKVRAIHYHISGLRSYDGSARLHIPYLIVKSPDSGW